MEFQEYQRKADTTLLNSLRKDLIERLAKLNLWGAGELAEAAEEYLKTSTKGHRDENESGMDIEHFVEELGDCFWCVSEICRDYNITLQQAAQGNLALEATSGTLTYPEQTTVKITNNAERQE